MPSAGRMLEILAENPVAQAKFFIISMRLFLEHVLGIMPFDEQLRANGTRASVVFPDGAASEFVGGAFPAIQQLHGPIEEQARLACHPHIVLHFVNRASQAWLRKILLAETAEAKELLRTWQQKTLLAVESLMSSCVGTARLQFEPVPFASDVKLQAQPYTSKWQEEVAWRRMRKIRKRNVLWFLWCRLLSIITCADTWLESRLLLSKKRRRG